MITVVTKTSYIVEEYFETADFSETVTLQNEVDPTSDYHFASVAIKYDDDRLTMINGPPVALSLTPTDETFNFEGDAFRSDLVLCETCGQFQGCPCETRKSGDTNGPSGDHNYGLQSTTRKHTRTGQPMIGKRNHNQHNWRQEKERGSVTVVKPTKHLKGKRLQQSQ